MKKFLLFTTIILIGILLTIGAAQALDDDTWTVIKTPDEATVRTRCDHGNRLYYAYAEGDKDNTVALAVVAADKSCAR